MAEKGYTLPEYHFVAEYGGAESEPGPVLEVRGWGEMRIFDKKTGEVLANRECALFRSDGTFITGYKTDGNGFITIKEINIGKYTLIT
jgi:hypothetical protein